MLGWTKIFEQINKTEIRSITDAPFKWGLYINGIGTVAAAFGHPPNWILIVLFVFGGLSWTLAIGAYIYFSKRNPDYLRSEKHQQTMKAMQIMGDKENADNKNVTLLQSILPPHISQYLGGGPMKSIDGK